MALKTAPTVDVDATFHLQALPAQQQLIEAPGEQVPISQSENKNSINRK